MDGSPASFGWGSPIAQMYVSTQRARRTFPGGVKTAYIFATRAREAAAVRAMAASSER